jgi:hypothetical protein
LHRLPNIVRVIRPRRFKWAASIAKMEKDRSFFKIGNISIGRPTRRWGDILEYILKK